MILISACLLGVRCRFDGGCRPSQALQEKAHAGNFAPVCPEQLGGLPTPRPAADLRGGDGHAVLDGTAKVIAVDGTDVTDAFIKGARETVAIARQCGVRQAILKNRSPSCGVDRVYVNGELIDGMGVTAAMLDRNGVNVLVGEESE